MSGLRERIGTVQRRHRITRVMVGRQPEYRCLCGWQSPERDCTWTDHPEHVADAVIRELDASCVYRYTCTRHGDFWFDSSERMQRFALLHSKTHIEDRKATE